MTLPKSWPLYAAILTFLLLVGLLAAVSAAQNRGNLIYAADDPYIGMATARNLAQFGVWGVTRYGFTSSGSTLLWTLLLAATDRVVGAGERAPLVWNIAFALLLLATVYVILRRYQLTPAANFTALLAIILLVPLPTLAFLGMEHTLQALLTILTVFLAARLLSDEERVSARPDAVWLFLLAPLVTATRFEGLFVVAAVCGVALLARRWRFAVMFAAAGALPVAVYGIISVRHGWSWFPASVMLKANLPSSNSGIAFILSLINPVFVSFREGLHTLAMLIAVLLVYIVAAGRGSRAAESRQIAGAITILLWLAHVEFVGEAPLYRYDAYLCALSIVFMAAQLPVVAAQLPSLRSLSAWRDPRNIATAVLAAILFFPQAMKGGRLLWFLPQCTTNIYQQQYQMGLFVRTYYQGATVALNDIGAVNFLADIHCLDLAGLANREVAVAKRNGTYSTPVIESLAQRTGLRVAIVYDTWFAGLLPAEWVRVGRWTVPNNINEGSDTVSFYAVNPTEARYLSQSLTEFSTKLPTDVLQRGQ